MTSKDCECYLKGGRCSSEDAPNPTHSWCIGRERCGSYVKKAHVRTIDKLKLILESQVEDPENCPKVTPVIEPFSEASEEDTLHLMLRDQQVGFVFDITGKQFLGIFNWKD